MTGPRVEVTPSGVLSGDQWEAAQYHPKGIPADPKASVTGMPRVLTGDEWEKAQTMTAPALKAIKLPALPVIAPRDATRNPIDRQTDAPGKKLAPFDIKDPTTYANPVLRQLVAPALENPLTTAAMLGAPVVAAAASPLAGLAVGTGMVGDMAMNIARYGYQKHLESIASPDARKELEADPMRISGEAAAVQAAMLGLAPLVHVGVKVGRPILGELRTPPSMEIPINRAAIAPIADTPRAVPVPVGDLTDLTLPLGTNKFIADLEAGAADARIPRDATHPSGFEPSRPARAPDRQPRHPSGYSVTNPFAPENVGKVRPLATEPPIAPVEAQGALTQSVLDYQAQRVAEEQAALAEVSKPDLSPRRRAQGIKNFFEHDTGAELLGTMAGRHGVPAEASPYPPATTLDAAWKAGHQAATESFPPSVPEAMAGSFPEGFSMGGALTDNRIPGAGEVPKTVAGVDGLQQSVPVQPPEGMTPETVALANALKPSRFRGHSTEDLANAALDAQKAIEDAQAAQVQARTRGLTGEAAQADMENRGVSYSDSMEAPSKTADRQLAAAKQRLAQIEREFTLRGVHGQDLADVIAQAKEVRAEREAMQQEGTLASLSGAEDPFATRSGSLTPIDGTGDVQTRGLSKAVEQKAIGERLATEFGDLPQYRTMSVAEQASQAADLLSRDPALARRVALGEVAPPAGLHPESVFVAVENRAIADGDVATIRDLANSALATDATTMGQRIRLLGERNPESPVAAIQSVIDARAKSVADVPKATEAQIAEIRDALSKTRMTQHEIVQFINSLRC